MPPLAGDVRPQAAGARLQANDVAAGNWVEMRVVFPSELLNPPASEARRIEGLGLPLILREERAFAEQYADQLAEIRSDEERLETLTDNIGWVVLGGLIAATLPATLTAYWIYKRHGREPSVPPVPEHIMEPPGAEPPALVAALLEPSGERATGDAFAATMFDLIRA